MPYIHREVDCIICSNGRVICPQCKPSGYHLSMYQNNTICSKCCKTGMIKCANCSGTGKVSSSFYIDLVKPHVVEAQQKKSRKFCCFC